MNVGWASHVDRAGMDDALRRIYEGAGRVKVAQGSAELT